ncbi:MAG TPA: V-type ATP synthase subunit D [Rectinemataceae bacterium]|nr:V-type ATP synthase subunit D [Rectinemataceae bacterium]
MAGPNVAPTKSNLIREKERLALAIEGYELLERKREILMMELMKRVEELRVLERELDASAGRAYPAMRLMLLRTGREGARDLAAGVEPEIAVRERTVQVAGLHVPSVEAEALPRRLQTSFMDSSALSDETVLEFTELLWLAARMAGLRSVVWRLAKEVRKTQRRVNALEKMVIPESRARKAFIEASLEEREREAIFAVKLLKARRAEKGEG